MAISEKSYVKLPGELKRKRKFFNRALVYWVMALFFVWMPGLFVGLIYLLTKLDKFNGIKDPICPVFFISYAILGPFMAYMLMKKTQKMTKFLWALMNATICPFLLILWLFAIARQP